MIDDYTNDEEIARVADLLITNENNPLVVLPGLQVLATMRIVEELAKLRAVFTGLRSDLSDINEQLDLQRRPR